MEMVSLSTPFRLSAAHVGLLGHPLPRRPEELVCFEKGFDIGGVVLESKLSNMCSQYCTEVATTRYHTIMRFGE